MIFIYSLTNRKFLSIFVYNLFLIDLQLSYISNLLGEIIEKLCIYIYGRN